MKHAATDASPGTASKRRPRPDHANLDRSPRRTRRPLQGGPVASTKLTTTIENTNRCLITTPFGTSRAPRFSAHQGAVQLLDVVAEVNRIPAARVQCPACWSTYWSGAPDRLQLRGRPVIGRRTSPRRRSSRPPSLPSPAVTTTEPSLQDLVPIDGVWDRLERVEERLFEASVSDDGFLTKVAQHLLQAGGKCLPTPACSAGIRVWAR